MKEASNSCGQPHQCSFDWPEDCFVQCGGNGIVLPSGTMNKAFSGDKKAVAEVIVTAFAKDKKPQGGYRTAFFEAFPRNPDTFIRGEGKTVEEAEQSAWSQYQKIIQCKNHEFEARGYENGAGFCKHCNLFMGGVFEPTERCFFCNCLTFYHDLNNGRKCCECCSPYVPDELEAKFFLEMRRDADYEKREEERYKALGEAQYQDYLQWQKQIADRRAAEKDAFFIQGSYLTDENILIYQKHFHQSKGRVYVEQSQIVCNYSNTLNWKTIEGSKQLAVAILLCYSHDRDFAKKYHSDFADIFIKQIIQQKDEWRVSGSQIKLFIDYLQSLETKQ
jgi:hypothetical protein